MDIGVEITNETGVGALLKASRQRCGENLQDVADQLRIRYSYLQALEEGRVKELPGQTYAVGFVRAYAEHLGLDANEVVRRFKLENQKSNTKLELAFPTPMPEGGVPGAAIMLVGVIIAGLAYGGWYLNTVKEGLFEEYIAPLPDRLVALLPPNLMPSSQSQSDGAQVAAEPTERPEPSPASATAAIPAPGSPAPVAAPAEAVPAAAPQPVETPAQAAPLPVAPAAPVTPAVSAAKAKPADAAPVAPAPAAIPVAPVMTAALPPVQQPAAVPAVPPPAAAAPVPPVPAAVPPAPAAAAMPPAPPAEAPTEVAAVAPEPAQPRVFGSENADSRILLRARADSWVQIRDGERRLVMTRLLKAGDSYHVPDQAGLTLVTGNAGALEVLVDGAAVPPVGAVGAVRKNIMLDPERLVAGTAAPN